MMRVGLVACGASTAQLASGEYEMQLQFISQACSCGDLQETWRDEQA